MAQTTIADSQGNGDSTPVLIKSVHRNTYGEVLLGIFGTFDGATVKVRVSRDDAGVDFMDLGAEATLTEPNGLSLNIPSKEDLYLFINVSSGGGSVSIGAEVYS